VLAWLFEIHFWHLCTSLYMFKSDKRACSQLSILNLVVLLLTLPVVGIMKMFLTFSI